MPPARMMPRASRNVSAPGQESATVMSSFYARRRAGVCAGSRRRGVARPMVFASRMNPLSSPLLTDLYELTMLQAYYERGMTDTAVFELFVRKLPPGRDFRSEEHTSELQSPT